MTVPAPVAATEKVAVCPTTTLWFTGWVLMATVGIPVPLKEIMSGEFVALLTMDMLPDAGPRAVGANWIWYELLWPAAMEAEAMPPTTPKPAPVKFACEMATDDVPVLVRVRVWGLLNPITTFPKFMLVELAESAPVEGAGEVIFAAGDPALVKPVQPVIDSTARHPRISANIPSGTRQLRFS